MCVAVRPQAQLALPVLVLVQAVTPPLLLATHLKRRRLEPWRGVLHACNVVLAVLLARFAIFDILQVCVCACVRRRSTEFCHCPMAVLCAFQQHHTVQRSLGSTLSQLCWAGCCHHRSAESLTRGESTSLRPGNMKSLQQSFPQCTR